MIQGTSSPLPKLSGCAVVSEYLEEETKLGVTVSAPTSSPVLSVTVQGWITEGGFLGNGSLREEMEALTSQQREVPSLVYLTAGLPWGQLWSCRRRLLRAGPGLRKPWVSQPAPGPISFTSLSKNRWNDVTAHKVVSYELQKACFFLKNGLFCIGVQLINNVVTVSYGQQRESAIIYMYPVSLKPPTFHWGCDIAVSTVPCAYSGSCRLSIWNIAVCTCPSQTPYPFSPGKHKFILCEPLSVL